MAFVSPYENSRGRQITAAYFKVASVLTTPPQCQVTFAVWESAEARQQFPHSPDSYLERPYPTVPEVASDNPIDYAYQLAQAGGEWPDAIWNV